jgi:hypothetical protein
MSLFIDLTFSNYVLYQICTLFNQNATLFISIRIHNTNQIFCSFQPEGGDLARRSSNQLQYQSKFLLHLFSKRYGFSVFKKTKQNVMPDIRLSSNSSINPHFSLCHGSQVNTGDLTIALRILILSLSSSIIGILNRNANFIEIISILP